jgi:hypothetical protein
MVPAPLSVSKGGVQGFVPGGVLLRRAKAFEDMSDPALSAAALVYMFAVSRRAGGQQVRREDYVAEHRQAPEADIPISDRDPVRPRRRGRDYSGNLFARALGLTAPLLQSIASAKSALKVSPGSASADSAFLFSVLDAPRRIESRTIELLSGGFAEQENERWDVASKPKDLVALLEAFKIHLRENQQ